MIAAGHPHLELTGLKKQQLDARAVEEEERRCGGAVGDDGCCGDNMTALAEPSYLGR